MVRNPILALAGLLALGVACLPTPADALQRTLPATKTATIVDEAGLSRMLVQFAPVTDLASAGGSRKACDRLGRAG